MGGFVNHHRLINSLRLQNQLICPGLEQILSCTEKCIVSYHRNFPWVTKIELPFHFSVRRKLSKIRCDKYYYQYDPGST